jgi:hypothetical protein
MERGLGGRERLTAVEQWRQDVGMAARQSAVAALQRAIPENDPAWLAALRAPLDEGPIPEQERLDLEAVRASSADFIDGRALSAEIARPPELA